MIKPEAKTPLPTATVRSKKRPTAVSEGLTRQTMGAQVAESLRRRIIGGELTEGLQLRQEQLAAEFGISKVPVREALNLLEAEGLVIQQFHRGAVVAGLSLEEIIQIFELRAQIEGWLVELACAKATANDIKRASRCAAAISRSQDPGMMPRLNWEFHEALYLPADREHILDYVQKLHLRVERFVKMQIKIAGVDVGNVVQEHHTLLELYCRHDPNLRVELHRHVMGSAGRLVDRLKGLRDTPVADRRR